MCKQDRITDPSRPIIRRAAISLVIIAALAGGCGAARAQQQAPAQAPQAASPAPQQQYEPSGDWQKLPKMVLERQFSGPLQDTLVQRWRDPADGTICYIYLPISAPHSPPAANGFVQYGSATIGTISCMRGAAALPAAPKPR